MDRRIFLKSSAAIPLAAALPRTAFAQQTSFNPQPGSWRTYEIATRVEVLKPAGVSRVWLPVPSVEDGSQKPLDNSWAGNAKVMRIAADGKYGAGIFYAEWPEGEAKPVVELTSRFMSRDRAADLSKPNPALRLDAPDVAFYTAPTELQPTDGIVRKTALEITRGTRTDMQRAKAIYEWIVDNTQRDPKTRGCGVGDIKAMLETGNLGGKCADLNALYVGLARSVGLPARDIYGLRVAKSQFGYRSLGAGTANVTRAQHCRAEVFLDRLRLGAGRSGRRAQGGAGGEGQADDARRSAGAAGAAEAVRRVGDELARVQHRARRPAPGIEGREGRVLHVPAARDRRRPRRQPRPGQLQVHDHRADALVVSARLPRSPPRGGLFVRLTLHSRRSTP